MPIYQYQCDKCNNQTKEIRKFTEQTDERPCDCNCGGIKKFVPFVAGDLKGGLCFKGNWFKNNGTY